MTDEERKARQKTASAKYYASAKGKAKQRAWRDANREKVRASARLSVAKWKNANPDKARAVALADREKNRAKARKISAEWRVANPDRYRESRRRSYEENRDARVESSLRWQKDNPHKVAIKLANGGRVSETLLSVLTLEQGNRCSYCGLAFSLRRKPCMDHFMPLALGGANDDANIVLACHRCNSRKRHTHPLVFMRRIGLIDERSHKSSTILSA